MRRARQAAPLADISRATRPRLIYYQDAHHFHAKRLDPPISIHKLQWPVDELLGTGVDALAFGLGYGYVYFHDSKVGCVVGRTLESRKNVIDWRITRMAEEARKMGTAQVREVIARGRKTGLRVLPSLKLQSCDPPGSGRSGQLKDDHFPEVCLDEKDRWHPGFQYCYDYAHPVVQDAKLNMVREMLEDYGAQGIELDFMYVPKYFRTGDEEKNARMMTGFVARVRSLADEIGREQNRRIDVTARVFHRRNDNLRFGLDVETWLKDQSIDLAIGQAPEQLFDTGVDVRWLADAANSAGAAAYFRPPRRIYDERTAYPRPEMYRALGQTLLRQGCAGMYLGYLRWPFSEVEYQILREAAFPETHSRRDKRYITQPREPGMLFEELLDHTFQAEQPRQAQDAITDPPDRQLPVRLVQGEGALVTIVVSDDLESTKRDGEMRRPVLTVRFSDLCAEDELEFRFNGNSLGPEDAEVSDYRALGIPIRPRASPIEAPMGMLAYWFRFKLDLGTVVRGENLVEVKAKSLASTAEWAREVNGVEIQMRYKEFVRPEGIDVQRLEPVSS